MKEKISQKCRKNGICSFERTYYVPGNFDLGQHTVSHTLIQFQESRKSLDIQAEMANNLQGIKKW